MRIAPELIEEVRRFWPLIRSDVGGFLTSHEGYPSKLFHHRLQPSFVADAARVVRYTSSGTIHFVCEFSAALWQRPNSGAERSGCYALLITVGGPKYAHEEQALRVACAKHGLDVCIAHGMARPEGRGVAGVFDVTHSLRARDHAAAFLCWWGELLRGFRWFFSRDVRSRRLFVAAISAMRDHHLYRALADRVLAKRGAPCFALSLLPSLAASVTLVEAFRQRAVLTGGLRSQLTGCEIEHIATNTDLIFGKCRYETDFYRELFGEGPPWVREGCVLSLPGQSPLSPIELPEKYALIIGTAPFRDQGAECYERYVNKCFAIARASGLPVVYKAHGLARRYDDAWFARHSGAARDCLRVDDVRRNRELIERAAIMIAAPTTLVYFAIQCECPVVLVDFDGVPTALSELVDAPMLCIRADQAAPTCVDWVDLQRRVLETTEWFERNYYLDKGEESIVTYMLNQSKSDGHKPAWAKAER